MMNISQHMLGEDMIRSMIDQQGDIQYKRLFGLFLIILVSIYGITSINIYTSPFIVEGLLLCLMILLMIQSVWIIRKMTIETLNDAQSLSLFQVISPIHLSIKQETAIMVPISKPYISKTIAQLGVMRI